MQNLLLKLATLVGVVGVVCLVLLQVNQGIESTEDEFDLPEVALGEVDFPEFATEDSSNVPDPFAQFEPSPGDSDESIPATTSEFENVEPPLAVFSTESVVDPDIAVETNSYVTEVEFQTGSTGPDFRVVRNEPLAEENQNVDLFDIDATHVTAESVESLNPFLSDEKQTDSNLANGFDQETVGENVFDSPSPEVSGPGSASSNNGMLANDDLFLKSQVPEKTAGPKLLAPPAGTVVPAPDSTERSASSSYDEITLVTDENSELTESGSKNVLAAPSVADVEIEQLKTSKDLPENLFFQDQEGTDSVEVEIVEGPVPIFDPLSDNVSTGELKKETPESAAHENISGPRLIAVPQHQEEATQDISEGGAKNDVDTNEPARLSPKLNAVPLTPDDLRGDGVVNSDSRNGVQRPNLKIEKIAPKNSLLGQPMVYTIKVRNIGDSAAHKVVVEDQIPKGSQLTGTIPRAELINKRLIWRLGQIEAGAEKIISVRVVPTAAGQIGSVATVNFVAEVAAKTFITAPELKFSLNSPKQVHLGDQVEVQFFVKNIGTANASKVFLRSLLPEILKHPGGTDLEYEIGTLKPGESQNVQLKLTAVRTGLGISKSTVTAEGDLSVEANAEIEVLGSQLSLSRNGPKKQIIGRESVFINTIQNDSTRAIQNIVVEEILPVGVEFSAASAGGQYHPKKRAVVWEIDSLNGNKSRDLTIRLIPKLAGELESTVQAFENNGVPIEISSKTQVVGISALSIETEVLSGPVLVGEKVSLRVKIHNKGSIQADNVDIKMLIPNQMELEIIRGLVKDSNDRNVVHFVPIEKIPPGKEITFDLVFKTLNKGDSRVKFQIQTDQMQQPLNREEAVVILSDTNN